MTANSAQEARIAYEKLTSNLGSKDLMLKAQVLAGGRGRGYFDSGLKGGVHVVSSADQAFQIADQMIGHHIHTKQTGSTGQICNRIMLAEKRSPKQEYYFAIVLDRTAACPVILASAEGGMNIEELARDFPEKLHKIPINLKTGLTHSEALQLASKLNFGSAALNEDAAQTIVKLYSVFMATDCTLLEINPMTVDAKNEVVCMDCKAQIDENAQFRHQELFAQQDMSSESVQDIRASEVGINYIKLDGEIGCLVNGAGLAMATMDLIKLHGGNPANFLDVGGGAQSDQIVGAFEIIKSDPNVRVILVNIFGGILKCDLIAQGIVDAAKKIQLDLPVVIRMQGTNMDLGNEILEKSQLNFISNNNLDQAAMEAVRLSKS